MAERRRTRSTADREPTGDRAATEEEPRRRGSRKRPAEQKPEPADDDLEPADDDLEPADDDLEPADDHELEPAEDHELESAEDHELEPLDDEAEPAEQEDDELAAVAPNGDRRRGSGRGTGRGRSRGRGQDVSALTAKQAAMSALRQIAELTAKQPEGITDVERMDDGGWTIGVEVVEDRRIPSSADILATYRATLDGEGELMSYQRVRRYARGRGDSNEGS